MKHIQNLFFITIGAFIFSFGLNYFTIANKLSEGGFTGIALLLNYIFGFSPSVVILILNVPLFIFGWRKLGHLFMLYTIAGTTLVSFFLWLTEGFQRPIDDLLLAALYAGVSIGIGLGIIFRYGGSTGGVDIIARLAFRSSGVSMGRTMFLFDLVIISLSAFFIDLQKAMYTLIAVFVAAKVIDFVQEGAYAAKAATIISDHSQDITLKIMKEMDRGATMLKGKGGYTGIDKDVLYCVISRNELPRLKQIVHMVDPRAFIVVSDVHDVLGEGFEKT
ncbi:YitT family protein [Tepidibacillus marianensis]|uniref:YitT family protein n=1 Tax=Tepidibacillus marianensis TaxID=3131995 RepID=UPI0030CCB196